MIIYIFSGVNCVSHMRKVPDYHPSHPEKIDPYILVHPSLYGLHASSKGSVDPAHLRRLDWALTVCIPVYEVIGLFMRRSDSAVCEQHRCRNAQSHQRPCCSLSRKHMGLVETSPVYGASNKARPKPVSPATETNQNIETSLVTS